MKKLILLLLPIFIFSQHTGKVISIKDGDTIVILDSLDNQTTLRLADVDCPESGQAFGKNAKQFTSDQVFGKTVKYYVESKDRYDRTIAKIYYDNNKYSSEEIIKNGYGWWYYKYSKNNYLSEVEKEAGRKKLGVWSDPNSVPPWIYRKEKRNFQNN